MPASPFDITARTVRGLEEILAAEVRALGAREVQEKNRAVVFRGDRELLYRCNLELRTALRILKPIHSFKIAGQDDLYKKTKAFDWSAHLDLRSTFAIDSAVHSPIFSNSLYAALKTKDAIVDQFRDRTGKRPSIDTDRPDIRLHLHLTGRDCTLSLDSSGESLHRRGYRTQAGEAPLSEVLAAGLVLASGWRGDRPFLDPMCGSGTIAIEAALLAGDIAPGLGRERFGFMNWGDFDAALWEEIVSAARARTTSGDRAGQVFAADREQHAVGLARANAERAGLAPEAIRFERADFAAYEPPAPPGVLVMNPPYGERMQTADVEALYKTIGDRLKQAYTDYEAWILSSNLAALKKVGLKPSRKLTVRNGPLECSFRRYELYAGSRDAQTATPAD